MYPSSQVLRGVCQEPFPTSIITMLINNIFFRAKIYTPFISIILQFP
nr:MAG TPA: hypothetical protein [Bacteriophage sp.]